MQALALLNKTRNILIKDTAFKYTPIDASVI